jgi:predicted transcriptional regulator
MLTPEEEGDCYELLKSGIQRELRTNAGRSLISLATELDISYRSLARYETGVYPQEAARRERYYRKLCELRAKAVAE